MQKRRSVMLLQENINIFPIFKMKGFILVDKEVSFEFSFSLLT